MNEQIQKMIFSLKTEEEFEKTAIEIFKIQAEENLVYAEYLNGIKVNSKNVSSLKEIPFLPVQLFKTHEVITGEKSPEAIFTSSGTTGNQSKHFVTDLSVYEESFLSGFKLFYGEPSEYRILALLPSYLERTGSSLIYMCERLIKESAHKESGFYLDNLIELKENIDNLEKNKQKYILIGVTFALLDFAEQFSFPMNNGIILETGGMKGRRNELIREDLHQILKKAFYLSSVHSEYGMTELLSQAYSKGEGKFFCPPWMKILIRDVNDPFSLNKSNKTNGGLNIIDLANFNSCSFIATQDLGRLNQDGSFEVTGRFDNSDLRGCNLMIS